MEIETRQQSQGAKSQIACIRQTPKMRATGKQQTRHLNIKKQKQETYNVWIFRLFLVVEHTNQIYDGTNTVNKHKHVKTYINKNSVFINNMFFSKD